MTSMSVCWRAGQGRFPPRGRDDDPPTEGEGSFQRPADQRQQLVQRRHRVIAHVSDADRRVLERAVPRPDRPIPALQRADDILGVLPFGKSQAGHGPAVPALARQDFDAMLGAPRFDARRIASCRFSALRCRPRARPPQLQLER